MKIVQLKTNNFLVVTFFTSIGVSLTLVSPTQIFQKEFRPLPLDVIR
ncbi:hypothetical protein [Adhaeribacter arboris]|nr:hypothetical protein [Adhaeribacter arboris]